MYSPIKEETLLTKSFYKEIIDELLFSPDWYPIVIILILNMYSFEGQSAIKRSRFNFFVNLIEEII